MIINRRSVKLGTDFMSFLARSALEARSSAAYDQDEGTWKALSVVGGRFPGANREEGASMAVHSSDADRTDERADRWVTPDYQIVETSLEVTAYFTAEG
ncbi:pyrroloquinoline quinone precursor peptide PqqA [Actinomadura soli]|uniref:Coenzyme PQQ synthesis protein A n=1 Tax=Actinomadura soli TaxID=2508997 RepID=A0A5C4J2M2_9ACTN|nr:pyrroloquinoline quinone precursor peptide PqqA [Actinomadura soli]